MIAGKINNYFPATLVIRAENFEIEDIEINALYINLQINLNLTEQPVRSREFLHTINERIKQIYSE